MLWMLNITSITINGSISEIFVKNTWHQQFYARAIRAVSTRCVLWFLQCHIAFISRICHSDHYREKQYLNKIRSPTLRDTVTKLRVDSSNTKDCKLWSFRFKSFETDLCEERGVKQDIKHILLYCNMGILQESRRIFTSNMYQDLWTCVMITS